MHPVVKRAVLRFCSVVSADAFWYRCRPPISSSSLSSLAVDAPLVRALSKSWVSAWNCDVTCRATRFDVMGRQLREPDGIGTDFRRDRLGMTLVAANATVRELRASRYNILHSNQKNKTKIARHRVLLMCRCRLSERRGLEISKLALQFCCKAISAFCSERTCWLSVHFNNLLKIHGGARLN